MKANIVVGVLVLLLVACASDGTSRDSEPVGEPREYATGSNLPRRGSADAKQVDKEAMRESMQQSAQKLGQPG